MTATAEGDQVVKGMIRMLGATSISINVVNDQVLGTSAYTAAMIIAFESLLSIPVVCQFGPGFILERLMCVKALSTVFQTWGGGILTTDRAESLLYKSLPSTAHLFPVFGKVKLAGGFPRHDRFTAIWTESLCQSLFAPLVHILCGFGKADSAKFFSWFQRIVAVRAKSLSDALFAPLALVFRSGRHNRTISHIVDLSSVLFALREQRNG